MKTKALKKQAKDFFRKVKSVNCPTFPKEKIYFNSKGLSHLFYKGSRAVKVLTLMPLAQEESCFRVPGKQIRYWAFEAVVDDRRIKVIVRQIGRGKKHFWSVIPAWRRIRGCVVNARGNLSKL